MERLGRYFIVLLVVSVCHYEIIVANTGVPTTDNPCRIGVPKPGVSCGRGTSGDCGNGYECVISPTDRFAVCCPVDTCNMPSETGLCRAMFRRWFFNARTNRCEEFIYGGCGGNSNNFETRQQCNRACRPRGGGRYNYRKKYRRN